MPVVPRPQQVLPPPVVGHLVEDPVALQHVERVQLIEPEGIVDAGAVLSELRHKASVVISLVQSYPVRAGTRNCAAGADRIAEAHPLLVVGVVAAPQEILVALIVGALVQHPAAAVHTDGVAAAEVGLQVGAVAAAFVVVTLEAPILIEGDLSHGC